MNIRYFLLSLILLILGNSLKASPPGNPFLNDNKRYLALMLLNESQDGPDDLYVGDIQAAHDKGFNAVYLCIPWQMVKCKDRACRVGRLPGSTSMNPSWNPTTRYWTLFDNQIAKAKQLGMKIALRISLSSQDVGYGTSKYLWGENNYAERVPGSPGEQGPEDLGYYDSRQLSFSAPAAVDSARNFVGEVMARYGYLEAENNLLFVAVTTSPTQEMEYSSEVLDYSAKAIAAYHVWYQSKYGTNAPSIPTEFTSTEGKKWYAFRHQKLKDFIEQMSTKIKSYNSNIKYIHDVGCAFDALSSRRGTLAFKSLNANLDGLKVNDGFPYDHRFSMDLLRTNLPGKWIMNEYLVGDGSRPSSELSDFINQSFAHGAKLFSVITNQEFLNQYSSVYTNTASQWLSGTMGTVSSNGSVTYTLSEILSANFYENHFSTATRDIYQEWLNAYNGNPSNAKPVNIYLNDDEVNGCTPPAAPVLSASPNSIVSGAGTNVTLSATGCSGGTITWSDVLGTGTSKTASPTATKTYTATCTLLGCVSPNGSVQVTVTPGACDFNMTATTSINNPVAGGPVTLTATCTGANCSGLTYVWSGNGISGTNSTNSFSAPATAGTYTYTVTTSKSGCTAKAATVSITVGTGNPCGFTQKGKIGTWSGLDVQTRQYTVNGTMKWLLVTAPTGTSNDKHFPRGANFAENSGVGWIGTAPAKSCFGGGDTQWGGLEIPSGITVPPGYAQGSEPDGAVYFAQNCTPPAAPALSAAPSTINSGNSSTLSASGCSGGTITWSDALGTGTSKTVSPTATKTYTATCSIGGCTSANGTVTVTVIPPVGGSGCVVNKVKLQFRVAGECCMDRLPGAKIQGSNNGTSWTDLYTFAANGTGSFQEFTFSNTTAYTSVRFAASANGYGELVELEFYNGSTKLTGTTFGTYNYVAAFDGSTSSDMWHISGPPGPANAYAGLNLTGCTGCSVAAPTLTASVSPIYVGGSSTLSASGCSGGTVTWSNGLGTGASKTVSPTTTTTYTATCTIASCTSPNGSVTVTVNSGANCSNLSSDVNGANCGYIEGWVYNSGTPNGTVNIDVYDGATLLISNYPANKYRQDLFNAGMGNGYHAFEIPTPSQLKDGQSHTLNFKVTGCTYTLNNSPRIVNGCSPAMLGTINPDEMIDKKLNIWISPNPSNGIFETRFYVEKGKKATLSVSDLQGRIIYRQSISGEGMHKQTVNLLNKASGTLFIQLHKENGVEVKKINVVR